MARHAAVELRAALAFGLTTGATGSVVTATRADEGAGPLSPRLVRTKERFRWRSVSRGGRGGPLALGVDF